MKVLGQGWQCPGVGQGFRVGGPEAVWHRVQSERCYTGDAIVLGELLH